MNKLDQDGARGQSGAVSGLAISLVLSVILLLGAIGFGYWAFASRQDYKNNSDAKSAAAVKAAVAQEDIKKDKQFTEDYKKPLKTYEGPEAQGSLSISYPKTWSGYVDTTSGGDATFAGFFHPGVVPSVNDDNSKYALYVAILNQSYSSAVTSFRNQNITDRPVTIKAYSLPKLPKVVGVKITGAISSQTDGTIIILPLRSQALEIETDGTQYLHDFNKYILPNFNFSP
jgi:hypothetical protein